jgi:glycosyltransferase involved in cell wall biosynthesis
MKFTIVTISYNQSAFLEECIQSVLTQDYPDIEYVVVDGGSTDGSLEIIERYRSRLSKVLTGPDCGPADALNKGFAGTTGDVLGYVNSDDCLLPGALRKAAAFLQGNPLVDFASGHCVITDATGHVLRRTYSDRVSKHRWIYSGSILLQPATFFRRETYERSGGFNVENRISWDIELFHRFIESGARHAIIEEFLAAFRVHPASITGGGSTANRRRVVRDRLLAESLGRELRAGDEAWRFFYRYWRKLHNYRDTWQRITGGPFGGRFAKTK